MYCQLYDLPAGRRQKKGAVSTTLHYFTVRERLRQPSSKVMHISFVAFFKAGKNQTVEPSKHPPKCMKIGMLPEMVGARNSLLAGTDELGKRPAYVKIELKNIYVQIKKLFAESVGCGRNAVSDCVEQRARSIASSVSSGAVFSGAPGSSPASLQHAHR
jgi:hypothetical protein